MITTRIGDLLDEKDLTHIVHQANLFHTFGAGLASEIGRRFPYALVADMATPYGDKKKLGTFSLGPAYIGEGPDVINLYSQDGFGRGSTDYQAMRRALELVEQLLRHSGTARLGIPYKIGCGLAGGDWHKVGDIIKDVFAASPVQVVIVARPQDL